MKRKQKSRGLIRGLALIFFFIFLLQRVPFFLVRAAALPSETLVVMLVIDTSGSMQYSDPQRLRETAARMFIDLLSTEDYLGIITFDHEVEVMLPLQQLDTYSNKELFKERLSSGLQPRGNTDYQIALEAACQQLQAKDLKGSRPVVVLLTDGEPDPDPQRKHDPAFIEAYMESLWETVRACAREGFPVYTVGFSAEIDAEVIRKISQDTGGECFILNDPDELLVSFFKLVGKLKNHRGAFAEGLNLQGSAQSFEAFKGWVEEPVFGSQLPELCTDLWRGRGYRQGEEVVASAFLLLEGKRLFPGRGLQVDTFQLILNFEDGSQSTVSLFDDGGPESGDIKASDGLWSNCILMEGEGKASVVLLAAGEYRGVEFLLEQNVGEISIHPPGRVFGELLAEKNWSTPGRSISIPLKIRSDSAFPETLLLEQEHKAGTFTTSRLVLEPGESSTIRLGFNLRRTLEQGVYKIPLVLKAENPLTSVEPAVLEFAVEVITPLEAVRRKVAPFMQPLLVIVFLLLAVGVLFYLLGLLLYCFLVLPRRKVKGVLFYRKKEQLPGKEDGDGPPKIKLYKARKSVVTISFDPENPKADFYIEGSNYRYDLIIKNTWESRGPAFLQGWRALLCKNPSFPMLLQCTMPGIIEYKGAIYTTKELSFSDEFQSGGFIFQYKNSAEKRPRKSTGKGVNILEGRV